MSLKGELWAKNLDKVLEAATSNDKNSESSLNELKDFFLAKLKEGFLPFTETKKYETVTASQIYQWIHFRYAKFLDFVKTNEIEQPQKMFDVIAELYIADELKTPKDALVALYYKYGPNLENEVLGEIELQNAIYQLAIEKIEDNLDFSIGILTTPLGTPNPSHIFTELFFAVIGKSITTEQTHNILRHFSNITNRVDEKLILYDYLEKKMKSDPITASLAIPYIVDVAVNRSVDYSEFYDVVFHAISPESLSIPGRATFFNTLGRTVTSHSIPAQTQIAFAVKLSRMLLHVAPDVQLDILSVIQSLARAHENVMSLMTPKDTQIANVDSEISDVTPQTLWEVIALKHSSVSSVAEAARTIGQAVLPPEYESFNLETALKASKAKPTAQQTSSNWLGNLDKSVWI
ncbi:hypothetical protein TVAG_160960 [Trichomonas vaginalis G3]|uniref:CCAAT-binding factor domain-containing protein n=1 Tax=Trichomonas vaginalis (strain ATCC PRA-98 / G3) TaxID=412133 RepID=A2E4V1_TRIV3|nr:maturation of SSU-rRNA from tricistronic rRNA transcript (SSU-rRNA, 5.8S rRNA, LSU-rRNA) [Trichomonas vaginalis G3]EAY12290.1 hypothetical protein TVAG_160960 [Trichomonas vaginalis G3]KAI5552404.1 maturation of SSU-rRNA from tricistronic rRNA transcript (SSU-rRNA, 5.8S rRNA, LSU-rRNA) [Trichomonas vaginalis G3]|eukprot:XP_001324513.1 hypothetical protein [Trichomonas vaginalis G3]